MSQEKNYLKFNRENASKFPVRSRFSVSRPSESKESSNEKVFKTPDIRSIKRSISSNDVMRN